MAFPSDAAPARNALIHALIVAPLLERPGRLVLAVTAIALGVALGVSVHLINSSAVNEFGLAARHLAGHADLIVRGPRAGFDESLYPRVAQLPEVEAANPAIELDVPLAGRDGALRLVGFDPLRAALVQPALLPARTGMLGELLEGDAALLSREAARWLGLDVGDTLGVTVGTGTVAFRIVGLLPEEAYRQRLAVVDIATAQWRLERLGRLNRIDLKLASGVNVSAFRRTLEEAMPPGVQVATAGDEVQRTAALSRAYRLNLDMLALIALFTGAFLVFSSQTLGLLRRRSHFALLRALGVTRGALAGWLVAEGAIIGVLGAACGVALGWALAHYAVTLLGTDLGAGYFRAVTADIQADAQVLLAFFVLGVMFAALGAVGPAWEAACRPPAHALRAGDEEEGLKRVRTARWGAAALLVAIPCALMPPFDGVPVGGYLAIAFILTAGVLLMPALAAALLGRMPHVTRAPGAIAVAQLKATPRQAAISIAAILISVSLMVSMLIMVHSFRVSLDAWLTQMLPADLYLRAGGAGETGYFTEEEQSRVAATPGIVRVDFLRSQNLLFHPRHPPITLLAREIDPARARNTLPLTGETPFPPRRSPPPAWVSERVADVYDLQPGSTLRLALGGREHAFTVAGVWRDYARQNGAVVIERTRYVELTGDRYANDAAIWVADDSSLREVQNRLQDRLPRSDGLEIGTTRELRESSLAIFDRTFAITYVLEAAAIMVGLFGVSVGFSAQALARRREFGVLRHIGMLPREIGLMLGIEGGLVTALGATLGLLAGWLNSVILVHVINRQSFHWSMEMHVPIVPLAALALVIVALAALTAVWSGRAAMSQEVVRAVREDW